MTDRDQVTALLDGRGAGTIEHPGGTLLEHLVRVANLLETWEALPDLVIAGLAHAAYGTDGFDVAPFRLDERSVVEAAIGRRSEQIVYRYASCDRSKTLGQIGRSDVVVLHDRFTQERQPLDAVALHEFAELSLANELDIARHSETFRRQHGPALASLFARWRTVVSASAYEAFHDTFDEFLPGHAAT
jgi:hypothetical protein